jgi:hypothetical protein
MVVVRLKAAQATLVHEKKCSNKTGERRIMTITGEFRSLAFLFSAPSMLTQKRSPQSQSSIEGIDNFLEKNCVEACFELTRRLLSTGSSFPKKKACSRVFLNTLIIFVAEYCCANDEKALRLSYWNADEFHGRKLELDQILSEHGVDICLLNDKHFELDRALRFANYLRHRPNRSTR